MDRGSNEFRCPTHSTLFPPVTTSSKGEREVKQGKQKQRENVASFSLGRRKKFRFIIPASLTKSGSFDLFCIDSLSRAESKMKQSATVAHLKRIRHCYCVFCLPGRFSRGLFTWRQPIWIVQSPRPIFSGYREDRFTPSVFILRARATRPTAKHQDAFFFTFSSLFKSYYRSSDDLFFPRVIEMSYSQHKRDVFDFCLTSCAGTTCHARLREFFVPKLQYFLSFKCIQNLSNSNSKTNNKFITF